MGKKDPIPESWEDIKDEIIIVEDLSIIKKITQVDTRPATVANRTNIEGQTSYRAPIKLLSRNKNNETPLDPSSEALPQLSFEDREKQYEEVRERIFNDKKTLSKENKKS